MKNEFLLAARKLTSQGDQFIQKYGQKKFHEEATRLLEKVKLHESFDYKKLVESSFSKTFNHSQYFKSLEFSDLPLTIARGSNCFIDVYFWRRRPTVIHNHHFSGAFQCLRGSNLDSEYKYKVHKKLTKNHFLGELTLVRERKIESGDVQSINVLDKFIHQNHHHADLTINLCFRTPEDRSKNLSNFLYSGLKFEKDSHSISRAQRLYAFTNIEEFDFRKINITSEDALHFLIQSHGSQSQNPRFLKLRKYLDLRIRKEFSLDLIKLMNLHEDHLDKIQETYN